MFFLANDVTQGEIMQVSQAYESDKYAVLGGGKQHSFQIAASAHAFKILSDALYQDKPMAIVRETICNVYDAHVAAGIADRPIEVTLSDTTLTFRDYGAGIPDDKISEIYLTYFGSTKTHDDQQIGGFGLGCKAPFCLTDHFMITSHHEGTKRTYLLSIGNDDTDGKPTAQVMATGPTEESGLLVSIPIEEKYRNPFERALSAFARNSGLPINLNGKLFENGRDYSGLEDAGFGLFEVDDDERFARSSFSVLYGHVLYPIDINDALRPFAERLRKFRRDGFSFVFYASPSSLSVQPSREGLGYNEKTVNALMRMMRRAAHELESVYGRVTKEIVIERFKGYDRSKLISRASTIGEPFPENDGFIGAEKAARLIAHAKLNDQRGGIEPATVRTLADYYRDHRKYLLRSIIGKNYPDMRWENDYHRLMVSRLARLIVDIPDAKLYFKYGFDSAPQSLTKTRRASLTYNSYDLLTVAPSVTAFQKSECYGFGIISKSITPEQIEEMTRRAGWFRLRVKAVEAQKRLRRSVIVREHAPKSMLFTPFKFTKSIQDRNYNQYFVAEAPSIETPSMFHPVALTRKKVQVKPKYVTIGPMQPTIERIKPTVLYSLQRDLNEDLMPDDACLPISTEERDRLVKMGIPRLSSVVFDRLRRVVNPRSEQHAFVAYASLFERFGSVARSGNEVNLINALAGLSRRMVSALFMQPYKPSAKLDEAYKTWRIARSFFTNSNLKGKSAWLDEAEFEHFTADQKRFHDLFNSFEQYVSKEFMHFLKRFRFQGVTRDDLVHLKFLAQVIEPYNVAHRTRGATDETVNRVIELIEAEGKRFLAGDIPPLTQIVPMNKVYNGERDQW
jgi:hypothetical protein